MDSRLKLHVKCARKLSARGIRLAGDARIIAERTLQVNDYTELIKTIARERGRGGREGREGERGYKQREFSGPLPRPGNKEVSCCRRRRYCSSNRRKLGALVSYTRREGTIRPADTGDLRAQRDDRAPGGHEYGPNSINTRDDGCKDTLARL